MTNPRPDGPPTGPIPTPTLAPDDVRAIEAFATWCDQRADRARRLTHSGTWRSAARLARVYLRTHA